MISCPRGSRAWLTLSPMLSCLVPTSQTRSPLPQTAGAAPRGAPAPQRTGQGQPGGARGSTPALGSAPAWAGSQGIPCWGLDFPAAMAPITATESFSIKSATDWKPRTGVLPAKCRQQVGAAASAQLPMARLSHRRGTACPWRGTACPSCRQAGGAEPPAELQAQELPRCGGSPASTTLPVTQSQCVLRSQHLCARNTPTQRRGGSGSRHQPDPCPQLPQQHRGCVCSAVAVPAVPVTAPAVPTAVPHCRCCHRADPSSRRSAGGVRVLGTPGPGLTPPPAADPP